MVEGVGVELGLDEVDALVLDDGHTTLLNNGETQSIAGVFHSKLRCTALLTVVGALLVLGGTRWSHAPEARTSIDADTPAVAKFTATSANYHCVSGVCSPMQPYAFPQTDDCDWTKNKETDKKELGCVRKSKNKTFTASVLNSAHPSEDCADKCIDQGNATGSTVVHQGHDGWTCYCIYDGHCNIFHDNNWIQGGIVWSYHTCTKIINRFYGHWVKYTKGYSTVVPVEISITTTATESSEWSASTSVESGSIFAAVDFTNTRFTNGFEAGAGWSSSEEESWSITLDAKASGWEEQHLWLWYEVAEGVDAEVSRSKATAYEVSDGAKPNCLPHGFVLSDKSRQKCKPGSELNSNVE